MPRSVRAYELMIIFRGDLADDDAETALEQSTTALGGLGARVETVNNWGKRKFAYEIDHRSEGYYAVVEFLTDGVDLVGFERSLRLADETVRHKLIRLPDSEATRRGLFPSAAEAAPAAGV